MSKTVRIEGLRELERNLKSITRATGRNALRRALRKGAGPFADEMQARAPRDKGDLAISVNASERKPHDHKSVSREAFADVMASGGDAKAARAAAREANRVNPPNFAEVFVGPGRNPQAVLQEFGTVNHPPQAFARPAWDGGKAKVLARVVAEIKIEFDKAVARAERKARKR